MRLTEICETNGKKYIRIKGTKTLYAAKERDGAPASNAIVRLAAYEDAEEQGRLVMLPVKPGDYLYRKYNSGMQVYTVYNVQVREDHFGINVIQEEPPTLYPFCDYINGRDIGKTVFLTREEAEAAMKGDSNDQF